MLLSARVLPVEQFFRLGTFTAASVQRDYVWDAQQSVDLLTDIERACVAHSPEPEKDGGPVISVAGEDRRGRRERGRSLAPPRGARRCLRLSPGLGGHPVHGLRAISKSSMACNARPRSPSCFASFAISPLREELRGRIGGLIQDGPTCRLLRSPAPITPSPPRSRRPDKP